MSPDDRLVAAAPSPDEIQYEAGLRPRSLDEYIGQALTGAILFGVAVSLLSGVIAWLLIPAADDAATISRRTSVRN